MGLLGFPNPDEISSMMGYVTDEDRAKWEQMKARSDAELQKRSEAGSKMTDPAVSIVERTVNAQMQGEMIAERERQREEREDKVEIRETRTRTAFVPRDDSPKKQDDDFQMS